RSDSLPTQLDWIELKFITRNENGFPVFTFEEDAVRMPIRNTHACTVGVNSIEGVVRRRIVDLRLRWQISLNVFNAHRTRRILAKRPLHNVEMVRAPIGDHAARIVPVMAPVQLQ